MRHYPFMVNLGRCDGSCNTIDDLLIGICAHVQRGLRAHVLICQYALSPLASYGLRDHMITCQHALPPQ